MTKESDGPPTPSTPQDKVADSRSDESMFVLSGTVATLYVTDGTVNLLKGMQGKMAATGMGAAIEGMSGSVANSAMMAMYDGEHVQHFGCYIGRQMVIGTFENVGFKEGDEVRIVATRLDDRVVFAHALVRPTDGLLWMPFSISKGRWEIAKWIAKLMLGIGLAGIAFFCLLQFFIAAFKSHLDLLLEMIPIMIAVGGLIGFLTYRSSMGDGLYAERIMKALGFRNPKVVNLSPFSQMRLGIGGSYQVYDLRRALKAYGSLSKSAPNP